ncbi:hypothetical protein [Protofrankia symbiont of Coriaria ruscifolia]|uniref:hypothetical protein n=1 Tax=Protofrankia symbiont of Coriaria ruscifolia TaxID=1306542 RepID=UPI001F5FC34C|nr:hypothetical protein [Protofrankia symbiont of Coriaria ruscifolia]
MLKDKGVPVPEIAKKLTIKTGKNAGKSPSVVSLYRALAEADQRDVETEAEIIGPRRPVRARITGPGSGTDPELMEPLERQVLGPQPFEVRHRRHPGRARASAKTAGPEVVDLRMESLHTEFFDVGAVIYFLRKVIWMVPDFTIARYRPQLKALHDSIQVDDPFVAHTTRFLIKARKPF